MTLLTLQSEHEPRTISFVDRSLCAAISKNFSSALVICEEHEFTENPAQLVAVPIFEFHIQPQNEKLIEVFYDLESEVGNDIIEKVVDAIRSAADAAGGSSAFDSKIILQYEVEAENSFLRRYGDVVSAHLKSVGFTVVVATADEVLQGATDFCYVTDFFKKSTLFKNY